MTTLGRRILLLRIAVPVLAVAGTGAGEGRAVSGDVLTLLGVDAPPDKGVDAPRDKGVCAPPDIGVEAPPDKGSSTSPGKDSAGTVRMARLLLALSSNVTATDDEAMRAFSTGSSSFALTPLGVDALPDNGVDVNRRPPSRAREFGEIKPERTQIIVVLRREKDEGDQAENREGREKQGK